MRKLSIREYLKAKADSLKQETLALYHAARDPRTPLAAKILAGMVVAYAVSPIDLIPDFIPVLGFLDDLVLVPLGIIVCLRMIPPEVMADARLAAQKQLETTKSWTAAAVVIVIWIALAVLLGVWLI
ncbi:MAG: YkvA family protein [Betaproteobacteria bacterium]